MSLREQASVVLAVLAVAAALVPFLGIGPVVVGVIGTVVAGWVLERITRGDGHE